MLEAALPAYVLFGGIDPEWDLAGNAQGLASAGFVLAATTHLSDSVRACADVVLPVAVFAETSGTYVNVEGRWQSWRGAAKPVGDSRPGWKVLRVLANALKLAGFEYTSSEEVRKELEDTAGPALAAAPPAVPPAAPPAAASPDASAVQRAAAGVDPAPAPGTRSALPWVELPAYQSDVLVRGSEPLAKTLGGQRARAVI
jgi:NADH-quinone oxidoreductase subunit G